MVFGVKRFAVSPTATALGAAVALPFEPANMASRTPAAAATDAVARSVVLEL